MSRQVLVFTLIVFLGLSYWMYQQVFMPQQTVLTVFSLQGEAWQSSQNTDEQLQVGDTVSSNRRVFVKDKSELTLKLEQTELSLEPNSSVFIEDISSEHIQISLDDGRIRARARRGSPRIEIKKDQQQVVLENGQIQLDLSELGGLQVKVEEGNAELSGYQKRLLLSSMEQGILIGDKVIRKPKASLDTIPETTRDSQVTLTGLASPGTRVEAASVIGYVQSNMRFSIEVPLKMGINQFTVIMTGPMDERTEFPIQIEMVPPLPMLHHAEINWQ